jgi:hypothetical protein
VGSIRRVTRLDWVSFTVRDVAPANSCRSIPNLSIRSPTVLPTFRPFPQDTFLDNPSCRLVLSDNATAMPFSNPSLARWAMEFDEPVLVSNALFGWQAEADHSAEATLAGLCGVSLSHDWELFLIRFRLTRRGHTTSKAPPAFNSRISSRAVELPGCTWILCGRKMISRRRRE